jgi:hypothetical protein
VRGCRDAALLFVLWLARQLRQLGDVHSNPSRLILAEQLGCGAPPRLILEIDTGELLPGKAGFQFIECDQGGGKRRGIIAGASWYKLNNQCSSSHDPY